MPEPVVMNGEIVNPYGSFISKSRYSRWIPELNRRETWEETVSRYCDYMQARMDDRYPGVFGKMFWRKAHRAILNLEVMPSMRGLMTAGAALDNAEVAIYNCSAVALEDVRSLDEMVYILCCGTGSGFSVERKFVDNLPPIPANLEQVSDVVKVEDSKEGWADAYRQYLDHLYNGRIPVLDITGVRNAGARLKTFGGRASGPQPLVDLIDFTIEKFREAAGRKMKPIEVHDIACKIGDVVVSGGVRRSALISLSDLDDYDMAKAKTGAWWEANGQRALANNSAVYESKPSIGEFLQEWGSLYESKSGERGIFNREVFASNKRAPRREHGKAILTNPCSEIALRSEEFCNLTEVVVKESDTLETLLDKVEIATALGTIQTTFTDFKYLRPSWKKNVEDERLLGVSLTGVFGNELMSGVQGKRALKTALTELRLNAIAVNKDLSAKLGINQSVAITCNKPSGTVSQLTDSSSGVHPWHSQHYIRSVRCDNKDAITTLLKESGVPWEPDITKPEQVTVFYFPIKAPKNAITRDQLTAIEHLDIWLMYKKYWCEHNPSVTISVKEDEWISVANWVYENWEEVGGVSFLPYSEHTYKQAPYQECSESTYNQWLLDSPHSVDWSDLVLYETEDETTGSRTLACTAGNCEVVDLVEEPIAQSA